MRCLWCILFLASYSFAFSQVYYLDELDGETISTCEGILSLGTYEEGQSFSLTICSDDIDSTRVSIFFMSNGFPLGTTFCAYDGESTSSPLISCVDGYHTGGIYFEASDFNSSGCLTIEFIGGVIGASMNGRISCELECEPREVSFISSFPIIDSDGFVNVCWDSELNQSMPVELTASGAYPDTEYYCNDQNNVFYWDFNDGSPIVSGVGQTTVTHTFNHRRGYDVRVTIVDSMGCQNTSPAIQKVRISVMPDFLYSSGANPEVICLGDSVHLCANYNDGSGISQYTPVYGPQYAIEDGGECIESNLINTDFAINQTLEDVNDLLGVYMKLEHSYLGDLTINIQCPNGQNIMLHDQEGGSTHLGEPIDNYPEPNDFPGIGYWYCLNENASQTMEVAASEYSTLPAGEYLPVELFEGLVGCPLNGVWTLTICDNWGADDGYLLEWYMDFNNELIEEGWQYSSTYFNPVWTGGYGSVIYDPNNENCVTGTCYATINQGFYTIQPFKFSVEDDFGCISDTAMSVGVYPTNFNYCCDLPEPFAGLNDSVCNLSYTMNATLNGGNMGFWTIQNGPGIVLFDDIENPTTDLTVSQYGEYEFVWTEHEEDNAYCTNSSSILVNFVQTFEPTLIEFGNFCVGSTPQQLSANNVGELNCSPNPELLNLESLVFHPDIPGDFTITNSVFDPCTNENLQSTIEFTVYDNIEILNFTEVCGPLGYSPNEVVVSFDVVNSFGSPETDFLVDGDVLDLPNSYFDTVMNSPISYSFTIGDNNSCSSYLVEGYKDCSCAFSAGTLEAMSLITLCQDDCSGAIIEHAGDYDTDGGTGVFEYIIHNGDYTPIAYSNSIDFCFSSFSAVFNTVYYVSAVCGFPDINGHVDMSNPCYSIAQSIPILWVQNPTATACADIDTCGNTALLTAEALEVNEFGYWTSNLPAQTAFGTNVNQSEVWFVAEDYNDYLFTWNVSNGSCSAKDTVFVSFNQIPNPYAGPDFLTCDNNIFIEAFPSVMNSSYEWTSNDVFIESPDSISTNIHFNYFATCPLTFTEYLGSCSATDTAFITFFQGPNPYIYPDYDTVCGTQAYLSAYNVSVGGFWTAYEEGTTTHLIPQPTFSPSATNPQVMTTLPYFDDGQSVKIVDFVWTEIGSFYGQECTGSDMKQVVFVREPNPFVDVEEIEQCGNCVQLSVDTSSNGWAEGIWLHGNSPEIIQYLFTPNSFDPNAEFCAIYNSTLNVDTVVFFMVWQMENNGCVSQDSIDIVFYEITEDVLCPEDVYIDGNIPIELEGATPTGGFYSGDLVVDNVFYPSINPGEYEIAYNYTVGSCESSCLFNIFYSASVDKYISNVLHVYPNPNNGRFIISYGEFGFNTICKIYNSLGELVDSRSISNHQAISIDVEPGLYFLQVLDEQRSIVKKLVVE